MTQENISIDELELPIKRTDGDTLEERLTSNAYENILPARYLRQDNEGNIIEDQEDLFVRVAKNIAVAEVVFEANKLGETVTVKPHQVHLANNKRHKIVNELFDTTAALNDDGELFVDDEDEEIELTEENVHKFSYDSVVPELENDEIKEHVEEKKDEFQELMETLGFIPNSPTLMNAGDHLQQLSACFVMSPDDQISDIHDTAKEAAEVFQSGGGTGYGFWKLRPYGDTVSGTGGIASGPITFMRTYDQLCETIAQGGTRRGAQMGIMRITHPDVIQFIHAKNKDVSLAHTLRLNDPDDYTHNKFVDALDEARELIDDDGRVPEHLRNAVEGHLSNFNISVGVTDEFMEKKKAGEDFQFINPRTEEPHIATPETKELYDRYDLGEYVEVGEPLEIPAEEIWERIVEGAHENGEPGVIYLERANEKHSFDVEKHPEYRMLATNPCLSGDMEVAVAGRDEDSVKISELAEDDESVLVYSLDDNGNMSVKEATAFKTKSNAKTITVETDGELVLELTPDHEVRTNNRGWVEAGNLEEGDSLRILKNWITNAIGGTDSSYKIATSNGELKSEHQLVARDQLDEEIDNKQIHHKNFDSLDNSPSNLEPVSEEEHQLIHDISGEENPIEILKERGLFEEYKQSNPFYDTEGEENPMHGRDRSETESIQCEECNEEFEVTPYLTDERRFCSVDCFSDYREETTTFTCKECGDKVTTTPSIAERRKYCSRECSGENFEDNLSDDGRSRLSEKMESGNPMEDDEIVEKSTENTNYEEVAEKISETREEKIESGELEKIVEHQGKVECRLCGDKYKSITNTHLKSAHGITVDEYKDRFPQATISAGKQVKVVENHKVTSIVESENQDVYDLNVPGTHNFFAGKNVKGDDKSNSLTFANVHNCGEQPLMEYEACNLGHINLSTLVAEDAGDWRVWYDQNGDDYDNKQEAVEAFMQENLDMDEFEYRIDRGTRFLENVVTMSDFPVDKITETVADNRKIGLGIMGLAQMFIQLGVRYGSDESNEIARWVMTHINHESKTASHELADERGSFNNWEDSKYADPTEYADWFEHHTGEDPEEWEDGYPIRNHNTTTIAPTGTTSMVGNTSGGCEPIYNVAYYKNVSEDVQGDEMLVEFDDYFLRTLEENEQLDVMDVKKEAQEQMQNNEFDGIDGLSTVPDALAELFVTTNELSAKQHAAIQTACQDGVDSAISKTVNAPNEATIEDAKDAFEYIYENGGKGVTYYRDGTRSKQVLTTRADNTEFASMDTDEVVEQVVGQAEEDDDFRSALLEGLGVSKTEPTLSVRSEEGEELHREYLETRERPDRLIGVTQRIQTGYGKVYVTVNQDENGEPFELFANIGHSGGYTNSFTESLAKVISIALRSGVDPEEITNELTGTRSPKLGWDNGEQIHSIPDAIGKALERAINEDVNQSQQALDDVVEASTQTDSAEAPSATQQQTTDDDSTNELLQAGEAPECPDCGSMSLYYSEGCKTCESCGWSEC